MKIGVDIKSVILRLGGNELLYLSICKQFLKDQSFQLLKEALAANDKKNIEIYLHTLKGVAANLGFIRLEFLCKALLDNIQKNELDFFQHNIETLSEEYYVIISVINEDQTFE